MANPPGWRNKPASQVPRDQISKKARVQLNAAQLDELIKQQGVRVRVYKTLLCPNVRDIDGAQHEIDCQLCGGSQFYDAHPIETFAYIQTQSEQFNAASEGIINSYSATATFLQGVPLQYFALIEIIDHTDHFIERIKRQQGNVDVLKYKAQLISVLVDSTGKEYIPGVDFSLDVNGSILWVANRGPQTGTIYSVHYEIPLQFRAVHAIHVNRFAQTKNGANIEMTKLNEQWALEKVYLAERRDYKGNLLSPNLIRDPDQN